MYWGGGLQQELQPHIHLANVGISSFLLFCILSMREIFVSVQCARNAPEYFADRLWRSMKGAGTNDSLLIRLVVSRSEVSHGYFSDHFV